MSDNIYKIVKLKYGIVKIDSSQPILQITPEKGEAKHQTNFELTDPEMSKLQRVSEIKPGKASRKERNGETNSERIFEFKVPEVPSVAKTVKKKKVDVKSLGATSKKGKKSELPDHVMSKLQREPEIKPVRAPGNYKCHPGSTQALRKKLEGPELANQFQRKSEKNAREQSSNFSERKSIGLTKVPVIATSKVIKKTNNKKHKRDADSKKSAVKPKQMNQDKEQKVDALMKYMYEAMRNGCQTPKPKERGTLNVTI